MRVTAMSFNIWGLPDQITRNSGLKVPFIDKESRMRGIGDALVSETATRDGTPVDIVCFQEAWRAKDRAILEEYGRRAGLSHSHYADLGFVGSGLMLLTRYPIEAVQMIPYTLNGKPQRILHGDWWAGKGAVYARLAAATEKGETFKIHVFNTHTHAAYKGKEYEGHRLVQLEQFGTLVASMAQSGDCFGPKDLVLAMGDFNSFRQSAEFQLFLRLSGMVATPMDTTEATCGNGKQIDFVCFRPSAHWIAPATGYITMKGLSDGNQAATVSYYSDHKAVVAAFHFSAAQSPLAQQAPIFPLPEELAAGVFGILEGAQQLVSQRLRVHTNRSLLSFIVLLGIALLIWSVEHQSPLLPVLFAVGTFVFFVFFAYSFFKFWELEKISECRRSLGTQHKSSQR